MIATTEEMTVVAEQVSHQLRSRSIDVGDGGVMGGWGTRKINSWGT